MFFRIFQEIKMFIPTKDVRSMKRVSPPKRGAAEPVSFIIMVSTAIN